MLNHPLPPEQILEAGLHDLALVNNDVFRAPPGSNTATQNIRDK